MLPLGRSLCKNKVAVIFSVSLWLLVSGLAFAADQEVELGVQDDLTVFGSGGTVPDPDVEIKGFSVFGSTNVLTYISTAPGNTVFNGAVQISSDVYVTGRSTFAASLQIWNPAGFSGNLFYISTGTANVIRMTGAGEIYANKFYGDISGATGQSSWNHIATQNIQLNGYWLSNDGGSEGIRIDNTGQAGVGVAAPQSMLDVGGSAQFGAGAAKSTFTAAGLLQLASALTVSYGGTGGTGLTGNTVLMGNGSNPIATTNLGIADQILRVPGAGGAPAFGSLDLSKNAAVGASVLGAVNGGTGLSSISAGQFIYGSGSNVFSALAGPASAGQAMRASGANSFGWASPLAADIDESVNRWVDVSGDTMSGQLTASSVTATGIGVSAAQLRLAANVIISSETSAALGGGVRISTNVYIVGFSSAAMYYGDGFGLIRASPAGSALTSANIWVGNSSNFATAVAMSGDATLANTGALTLKNTGTSGTYRSVTTDVQGRVTAGTNPTTFAGYGLSDTSANLAAVITDETGTGALVFNTAPNFTTSANSPLFQGVSAAVTFGNASYGATLTGSALTIVPTAWTAVPTISGLITATSGLTANGALTVNAAFTLGDNGGLGSVNTSDWDISTTGGMTGISGIANDGGYTQTGASDNTFTGPLTASSVTATGIGVSAAQLRLAANVIISSETSAALGGGVRISSNVYIVGFSSAAKYYGDGSSLNNIPVTDSSKVARSGDTMTGALTLPADPSSALQAATKQYVDSWTRPCVNPGDVNDIMVPVGDVCVDKYETSVWSTATGGTQYGINGAADYPCGNGLTGSGQTCAAAGTMIYARSVSGVKPSTSLTWFQANIACANAGKHLLTNAEWQAAAAGTPDPGELSQDSGPQCNTSGTQSMTTGLGTTCRSSYGVENMIGSVWEWVADWGTAGAGASNAMGTAVPWVSASYNGDQMWNIGGNAYNGSAWAAGQAPAVLRGGGWVHGAAAGVFAFLANDGPSNWGATVGFRCGRRR